MEGDAIRDTLVERSTAMFMHGREELPLRMEALMIAFEAARDAGMERQTLDTLTKLILHTMKNAFRRALNGEPPALAEPMRIMLKSSANVSRMKAKLRPRPPDQQEGLENHMGNL